jgi:plasmid stabilization system protein ParE
MKLAYLAEARQEVLAAVNHYYDCDGGENSLAAAFYKELLMAERDIIEMPELWGNVGGSFRRKLMKRFPFGVIYHQIDEETIEVVAVAHQKRKPNYWME